MIVAAATMAIDTAGTTGTSGEKMHDLDVPTQRHETDVRRIVRFALTCLPAR